jgi:hypothetical protein
MLELSFTEPPISGPLYRSGGANIFRGKVYVTLRGAVGECPPPKKTGIDWSEFRSALAELLQAVHPPGTKVKISQPTRPELSLSSGMWDYNLTYSLK